MLLTSHGDDDVPADTLFDGLVSCCDLFQGVSGHYPGAQAAVDQRLGQGPGGGGPDLRSGVVAAQQSEGDVFEAERPVRNLGPVF